jgi:DNA-binding transcriptional ArsR family regulator
MSQPAISKHLKVLERAGLITRDRDAQKRLSKLEAKPMAEAVEWLADYRKFWESSFAGLDELLVDTQKPKKKKKHKNKHKKH